MFKSRRRHARSVSALVTGIALSSPLAVMSAEPPMPVPTISVVATGTVDAAPDLAVLTLTVMREAETARAALDANNAAMAQVLDALKQGGVAARDLQTAGFRIDPRYSYPQRGGAEQPPPKLVGYTVRNTVTARVRELSALGRLLDTAVTLGVNQGGEIRFTNAEPEKLLREARSRAMKEASDKAATLAAAAGVALGRIESIEERTGGSPPPVPMMGVRAMAASADSVPLEAGENTYSVTVSASWAIAQ